MRGRFWVAAAAGALAVIGTAWPIESRGESAPGFARAAAGGHRVEPPTPAPVLPYPFGGCDTMAPGLPGLNAPTGPPVHRHLGSSRQGRPIWAEYWGPQPPRADIVVVGQIHGNECAPTLLVEAIRSRPPNDVGIWLIPTLNPDGYAALERRNTANVDLNADGGRFSQPESRALRDFIADVRPRLTVHVHSPNGFAGAYPQRAAIAGAACLDIARATSIRCAAGGAGSRADRNRWFLWQGLAPYGGETLLVEFRAIHATEVPWAMPRPPTSTVEVVRAEAHHVLAAILEAVR